MSQSRRSSSRRAAWFAAVGALLCWGLPGTASALKLCTFELTEANGPVRRIGVLTRGGNILDLNRGYALMLAEGSGDREPFDRADLVVPPDMVAWLEQGEAGRLAVDSTLVYLGNRSDDLSLKAPDGRRAVYARSEVRLLAPVPRPPSLRDAGGFIGHMRKTLGADPKGRQVMDLLEVNPLYVTYAPTSVAGTEIDVLWPNYSDVLDYELEIAAVVGRKGRNIPESEAPAYIAGYTIYNDVSARDYQFIEMTAPFGAGKGKSWDGGNLLGPYLVTTDEFNPDGDHAMVARVNGEEWSRGLTSAMDHKFAKILSFISEDQTLYPGDVIGSATVAGGSGIELKKFINPGDVVELEVDGIGILRNRFVKAPGVKPKPFPSALATLLPNELSRRSPRPMKVVRVADRVYAGIQEAPGVVAYSNMFYIASGAGLIGDTLLDVRRTGQMMGLFRAQGGPWPVKYLVNTHADADHIWGNQLFLGAEIIAHKDVAETPLSGPKEFILAMSNMALPKPVRDFIGVAKEADLRDVVVTKPNRLLADGEVLELDLGGVPVLIRHVGPAHKSSDVVVYLPKQKVLFAGDLVFNGLTPHITSRYEDAMKTYRYLESLDIDVVIPGHGDVTDKAHLVKTRQYFEMLYVIARNGQAAGIPAVDAAKQAIIGEYADWGLPGHMMVTLNILYQELSGAPPAESGPLVLRSVAEAVEVEEYWRTKGVNQPRQGER